VEHRVVSGDRGDQAAVQEVVGEFNFTHIFSFIDREFAGKF
jgi:hypothetical protein